MLTSHDHACVYIHHFGFRVGSSGSSIKIWYWLLAQAWQHWPLHEEAFELGEGTFYCNFKLKQKVAASLAKLRRLPNSHKVRQVIYPKTFEQPSKLADTKICIGWTLVFRKCKKLWMGPFQIMLMSFSWTRSFDSRTFDFTSGESSVRFSENS